MAIETIAIVIAVIFLSNEMRKVLAKPNRTLHLQIVNFLLEIKLTLTDECAAEIGRKHKWINIQFQRTLRSVPMIGASYGAGGTFDWGSTPSHWRYNIYSHSWYAKETDHTYNSEMPITSKKELKDILTGYLAQDWRFYHISDDIKPLLKEFELDGEELIWDYKKSLALQPDPANVFKVD